MEAKSKFDRCHRARDLSPALPRDLVWIPDSTEQRTVRDEITPRSYEVETPSCTFRRNRRDIIHLLVEDILPQRPESHDYESKEMTSEDRTQSGGGFLSPLTHCRRWSSHVMYNPDLDDPCAG